MFEVLFVLLGLFGAGFASGYGVRELISRRRRRGYRRSLNQRHEAASTERKTAPSG